MLFRSELILAKLRDLMVDELERYLKNQQRTMIGVFENLWEKYSLSLRTISTQRDGLTHKLNEYFEILGYAKL